MNRRLYVSTNSFQTWNLNKIFKVCKENSLKNIELSSCKYYNQDIYASLIEFHKKDSFQFLLHNYFPPSSKNFVLNLASNDPHILELSRQHCLDHIDLAAQLEAPFYSVHAGFCFHANAEQLGKKIDRSSAFPKEEAQDIFIESVQQLADYALKCNVVLAIENNVVPPFNLVEGKNELLLGVTAEELMDMIESVQGNNVAFLIDIGHLKVSAQALGFSPHGFIQDLSPHTIALHLSDNNGFVDKHKNIEENSWFWGILSTKIAQNVFWILEVARCSIGQIIEQVALVTSHLERSKGSKT